LTQRRQRDYRADIDGLRAIAVLAVLAQHVGIRVMRGGFIGVDVFFVISGYLISQVLIADIDVGRSPLVAFYVRRVRRILPALVVVEFATFVCCLIYVLPSEFVDTSRSLVAAALSVSNVYFWLTSGYFDRVALSKPLLHTWSLGVEEQFYLFWPLLITAACKYGRKTALSMTLIIGLLSIIASAIGAFTHPSATFYLVHTRAWELLLGAVLALGAFPNPLSPLVRSILGVVGLLLIGVSVFTINSLEPFPGLLAIPPCLGTAFVILAGRDGTCISSRLLSWQPVVFIGLISYSLYLWHWPVIVFQRNYAFLISGGSEKAQKAVMVAASLILATLSWKFVEQPFRVGRWHLARGRWLRMGLIGTCAAVALGLAGVVAQGFPARYSARELEVGAFRDSTNMVRLGSCFLEPSRDTPQAFAGECLALDPKMPNYLLLGDSHAAELWLGLSSVYDRIHFLQATATDCLPTTVHDFVESRGCVRLIDAMLFDFLTHHRIDRVILAAKWRPSSADHLAATLAYLKERSIPVTVIGPTIIYDSPLPRLLVTAARSGDQHFIEKHWDHSLIGLDSQLSAVVGAQGAEYFSMLAIDDDRMISLVGAQGLPLLIDQEHFSSEGSLLIAHRMKAAGLFSTPGERMREASTAAQRVPAP
jgi:peptidoglycan/LPS O-acetylase OafA/YrhL